MSVDTIIIGGGFAGVTAARELTLLGQNVVLLEARDRLGGRTWTTHLDNNQIELGGAYVHHTQPFVWSEIQRYGLHVENNITVDHLKVIYFDGEKSEEIDGYAWTTEMMPIFQQYFENSLAAWPRPYDAKTNWDLLVSLDSRTALEYVDEMDLTPMQRITLISYLESCAHNKIQNTSYVEMMRWYALSGHNLIALSESVGTYKTKEGTATLVNAIAADSNAEIKLSTKVVEVDDSGDRVSVTTEQGEKIKADNLLLTVPINVIDQINFNPPLQQQRIDAALEKHSGAGFKVILKVKGDYQGIWCACEMEHCPLNAVLAHEFDGENTIMIGFGYSEVPVNLKDYELMQTWMRNFISDIEIIKSTGHSWAEDPMSLGTWCSYRPGQLQKYYDVLRQDQGHIYFAGSDLANGWRGFIDGAIESGIKAARRIVQ